MRNLTDQSDIFDHLNKSFQAQNSADAEECIVTIKGQVSQFQEQVKVLAKALLKESEKEAIELTGKSKSEELAGRISYLADNLEKQVSEAEKPLRQRGPLNQEQWKELQHLAANIKHLFDDTVRLYKKADAVIQQATGKILQHRTAAIKLASEEEWESVRESLHRTVTANLPKDLTPPDFTSSSLIGKNNQPPHQLSKQEFAHIHGDVFISETGLEGAVDSEMVGLLQHFLKKGVAENHWRDRPALGSLSTLIDNSLPMIESRDRAIKTSKEGNPIPKELEKEFNEAINKLGAGQSLLFGGGWAGEPGHAIYLRLTRLDNGNFTLRIYNKGAGLEYHPGAEIDGKDKYHPFVDLVNIPSHEINYTSFMLPMVQMKVRRDTLEGAPARYSAKDFYDSFLSMFDGQKVSYPKDLDHYTVPHHSGICSWAGLEAVIEDYMNPAESSRLIYEIKLSSLVDFFESHATKLESDEELRLLIKQGVQQFARECLDHFHRQIISQEELKQVYATVSEISAQIEKGEKSDHALRYMEAPQAELSGIPVAPLSTNPVEIPPPLSSRVKFDFRPVASTHYLKPPFAVIDPARLPQLLSESVKYCDRLYESRDFAALGSWITQVLEQLPVPKSGERDIWNDLTPDEREYCMVAISSMSEHLLSARTELPLDKHQRMEDIVNVFSALTVLHKLAILNNDPEGLQTWSMPWNEFSHFFGIQKDFLYSWLFYARSCWDGGVKVFGDCNLYDVNYSKRIKLIYDYTRDFPDEKESFRPCPVIYHQARHQAREEKQTDIHYVYEYLKKPENLEKFYRRYKEADFPREIDRVAVASCDLEGEIMPPTFCALKKQSLLAQYILKGDIYTLKSGRHPLFLSPSRLQEESSRQINLNNKENWYGLSSYENKIKNPSFNGQTVNNASRTEFYHSYQDLKDEDLQKILALGNGWDWDEGWIQSVPLEKEGFKRLRDSEIRELLLLRSKSDTNAGELHWELQVKNAVSRFQGHLSKLKDPEFQAFAKIVLFENNYISQYLQKVPEFAEKLLGFALQGYHTFLDEGDYKTCAYFVGLLRMFSEEIVRTSNEDIPASFRTVMMEALNKSPDPRSLLRSLMDLAIAHKEPEALAVASAQYIATFLHDNRPLNGDDAADLLKAACKFTQFPSKEIKDSFLLHQVKNTLFRRTDELRSLASNEVLNKVTAYLTNDSNFQAMEWDTSKLPICISADGRYTINISDGKFYEKGKIYSELPSKIITHSEYQALFGGKTIDAVQESPNCFISRDGSTRFFLDDNRVVIQRKMKGDWCQLIPKNELSESLKNGLGSKALYEFHSAWISCDDQPDISQILFIDTTQGWEPAFTAHLSSSEPPAVESIKKGNLSLIDIYKGRDRAFDFLSRIEELHYINIWEKNNEPAEIELPRLGLNFKVKNEEGVQRAYCNEFPGYYIALHQSIRELTGFSEYLVLENGKGQKQVIIPNQEITVLKKGSLTANFALKKEYPPPQQKTERSYFSYGLDSLTGRIASQDPSSNMFLGMLFLAQKSYERAQGCFRQSARTVDEFSVQEKQLFNQLKQLYKNSSDGAPKASAAYLAAQGIYFQNLTEFGAETVYRRSGRDASMEELKNEYLNYLTLEDHAATLKLRPEEEIALLNNLCAYSADERLANRLAMLKDPLRANEVPTRVRTSGWQSEYTTDLTDSLSDSEKAIRRAIASPMPDFAIEKYSFFRPGTDFSKHFRLFYTWAQVPDHPQKPLLRQILSLLKQYTNADANLRLFLLNVLNEPEKFPSFEKFFGEDEEEDFNLWEEPVARWPSVVEKAIETEKSKTRPGAAGKSESSPEVLRTLEIKEERRSPLEPLMLRDPIRLTLIKNPQSLFQIIPKPQREETLAELVNVLDENDKESAALIQDIREYAQRGELAASFRLQPSKMKLLKAQLAIQKSQMFKQSFREETELLALANKLPAEMQKVLKMGMEHAGTIRTPATMQQLLLAFLRQRPGDFADINSILSPSEIAAINQGIAAYLEHATLRQQAARALDILEQIEKLGEVPPDDPDYLNLSRRLLDEISAKRNYSAQDHPEYLIFEHLGNVRLRKDQVYNLEKMMRKDNGPAPNVILQMIMGAGKSKILLPILALKKADGHRLPIVVVPEALYKATTQNMLAQSGDIFEQYTQVLHFDRNTEFTVDKLQSILKKMNDVRKKQNYLMMTPKSLHCLYLKYREALYLQAHGAEHDTTLEKKINLLQDILTLIKDEGDAIWDEADEILNVKLEVNFTVGKPEPLRHERRALVAEFFRTLARSPLFFKAPTLTEEEYNKDWKQEILNSFINKIENNTKFPLHEFIKNIGDNKELLLGYLLNKGDAQSKRWMDAQPELISDLCSILKKELTIARRTLSKHCDVDYGFSDDPKKRVAVPFMDNTYPNKTSDYEDPYELAHYTIQTYLLKGVPVHILTSYVKELQKKAFEELQNDRSLQLHETAGYKQFSHVFGEPKNSSDFFHLRHHTQFEHLAKAINQDPERIISFVEDVVLPDITIPPRKMSSNPQSLFDMFATVQGFTATPNEEIFPGKLKLISQPGTDGKTISILWEKSRLPENTLLLKETTFPSVVNTIIQAKGGIQAFFSSFRAIIDTGFLFKGIENENVAREILKQIERVGPDSILKGVTFFKGDELHVLETGKSHSIPYSQCRLAKEQLFTYYDQRHSRGSDIPLTAFSKAIMTISNDLTLPDFIQGAGRPRELDKGQSIDFVVTPEAAEAIRTQSGLHSDKISLIDSYKLIISNNKAKKEDHLLSAVKQIIRNVAEREIMSLLRTGKLTIPERNKLLIEVESLLAPSIEDRPYSTFGKPEKIEGKALVISVLIENISKSAAAALTAIGIPLEETQKRLSKAMNDEIAEKFPLLPDEIPSLASREMDNQIEVEKEQQKEQETLKEQEIKSQSSSGSPNSSMYLHWQWLPLEKVDLQPCRQLPKEEIESIQKNTDRYSKARRNGDALWAYSTAASKSNMQPPILEFNDLLHNHPVLNYCKGLFDPELRASYNFCPLLEKNSADPAITFPVKNLLVSQDPDNTENVGAILISQKDVCFFSDYLKRERFNVDKIPEAEKITIHAVNERVKNKQIPQNPFLKVILKDGSVVQGHFTELISEKESLRLGERHISDYLCMRDLEGKMMEIDVFDYKSLYLIYTPQEMPQDVKNPVLGLYDLNLGLIQSGAKKLSDKDLNNNPKIAGLIVQAKFLSGELIYTAKEKKILREWLKDKNLAMVETFFVKHILKNSPDKQSLYPQSALAAILRSVKGS